ncbi:MAG: 4-(cytidine 5'-diphospho)-2-C-methyl-D-erythritol kinase [Alphaproteobacteria bacterium]|nr:4-(cytidine 5'-diphospho)-2-C-methyl-D-erythritol kinase [Alphaproteobacteria bacterium]
MSPAATAAADGGTVAQHLARAKINLYLHLLGRRPDGYHLLDSLIVFAELGDVIEVAAAERLSLGLSGPFGEALSAALDQPGDNLVLRAGRALSQAEGIEAGARIALEKRLPPAAGIGGGSSDAAATLLALAELWRLRLDAATLARIGLGLGADVPACLAQPASVFVGGIGGEVRPTPRLPPAAVLLVNPGVRLATADVFRAFDGAWSAPARFETAPASAAELAALLARRGNDLEAAAMSLAPEIGDVLTRLEALPEALLARMSGSGATCFALFAETAAAERARARLAGEHPDWWLAAAPLSGNAS